MRILLLGSGGREHAIALKLSESPLCTKLFTAPGNPGTEMGSENGALDLGDFVSISDFLTVEEVDMLVVGPEQPLVGGLVDFLREEEALKDLMIIGPFQDGAMLEGSKSYAKSFMDRHNIPTAGYLEVKHENIAEGESFIDTGKTPVVLKADGLAGGKGVLIIDSKEEAKSALKDMLDGQFGEASSCVVIEEFMEGIEFSVFVLTDGLGYKIFPVAKDYKRIGENDTGLNTGGMGAVSPPPFVTADIMSKVDAEVIKPTLEGLRRDMIHYTGFIYIGLMLTSEGSKVVEYNVRLGDPETQAVLPRLDSDLLKLFEAAAKRKLSEEEISISSEPVCTIILASDGYPQSYEKGKAISFSEDITESHVYHAGTKDDEGKLVTSGGRVMAISSKGASLEAAIQASLDSAEKVNFEGKYFRRDIGKDVL